MPVLRDRTRGAGGVGGDPGRAGVRVHGYEAGVQGACAGRDTRARARPARAAAGADGAAPLRGAARRTRDGNGAGRRRQLRRGEHEDLAERAAPARARRAAAQGRRAARILLAAHQVRVGRRTGGVRRPHPASAALNALAGRAEKSHLEDVQRIRGDKVDVLAWTDPGQIESVALDQLRNIAKLPWVFHHVAAMADVHYGKGATVGSVIAMKDAVSPAAVGVDIGCGMAAVRTSLAARDLPDSLGGLRSEIERAIPVGFEQHRKPVQGDPELWRDFQELTPAVRDLETKARHQLGTLGGGNHFIELCLDTEDRVWMMLHSGSRNIGKTLADVHIGRAKKLAHNRDLPDRDLAVFLAGTREMEEYRRDLFWAQRYAMKNRETMLELYKHILMSSYSQVQFDEPVACHHNYVAEETHFGERVLVTRKGAIRAGQGELGIIPGSMGTRSFIVRGLGNPDSFQSASHGAGRRMSRGEAKRRFTVRDLEQQTKGVECRKDGGVIDEIPAAYKPIERVMQNQRDLVEIV